MAERKVLNEKDYGQKATGAIKRLKERDLALYLSILTVSGGKKEDILRSYKGEDVSVTERKMLNSLYYGSTYEFGKADEKQSISIDANPTLVDELVAEVPEEEFIKIERSSTGGAVDSTKRGFIVKLAFTPQVPVAILPATAGVEVSLAIDTLENLPKYSKHIPNFDKEQIESYKTRANEVIAELQTMIESTTEEV